MKHGRVGHCYTVAGLCTEPERDMSSWALFWTIGPGRNRCVSRIYKVQLSCRCVPASFCLLKQHSENKRTRQETSTRVSESRKARLRNRRHEMSNTGNGKATIRKPKGPSQDFLQVGEGCSFGKVLFHCVLLTNPRTRWPNGP